MFPLVAQAQSADFTLSVADEVSETGFLQHLLPRFSLKHGIRITQVADDGDVVIGEAGVPVFAGLGQIWHVAADDSAGPAQFTQWLLSDIGKRTIEAYQPDGTVIFSGQIAMAQEAVAIVFDGDQIAGEALSLKHCGRCHVINHSNRMDGIGQAPSFAVLRGFGDWDYRFSAFYVLNPHPSFTQVDGITAPFPANLPPAIVPVRITQDELDNILSYVTTLAPADLGAPLQHQ